MQKKYLELGRRLKKYGGIISASIGFLISFYIVLGMFHIVPLLNYYVFGETLIRFLTQIAIMCFLVTACAFWEV